MILPSRPWRALALGLLALGGATAASAQDAAEDTAAAPPRPPAASPLLDADHWAVLAADRAYALGLADGYLPAQRAVPRHVVWDALARAAAQAEGALSDVAEGWLGRFVEEFPEYAPRGRSGALAPLGARLSAGYGQAEGRLAPAVGYAGTRQPPLPIADEHGLRAGAAAGVRLGRAASLSAEAEASAGEVELARWQASAGAGGWMLSVGREELGYGAGRRGAVVLSPREPIPRVEVQTTTPFVLPSVLRWLGPVSTHVFLTRLDDDARHPTEPWFWGMRVAVRPHPRLTIAGNRAAIFGGEGRPATVRNVLGMIVGEVVNEFESQIVSGDVRWRVPTDPVVPLTAYLEWGADDGAGAAHEMPARIAGLYVPAVPGVPELGLGVEYTSVPAACCGHGAWYFNYTFRGNWAAGDQLLAHPLGGEGWEAATYAQVEALRSRLRVDARGYLRARGDRSYTRLGGGNLFGPERVGRSRGGSVTGALRIGRRADLRLSAAGEAGTGWSEHEAAFDVAVFF